MNFEEHTGDLIGSATGAKHNTNKVTLRNGVRGVLGKRSERIEAARMFLNLFLHEWTSPCSLCKEMITRK